MRSLGLTDRGSGSGRGALRTGLLAGVGIAALVLVAVLGGTDRPVEGCAPGECSSTEQATAQGALAVGHGDVSALQWHRPVSPARGRAGFASDTQTLQRAVQARHAAIVAAMGQRIRWSEVPASKGHAADRPPIVTRPLRGPPSHG